MIFTFWKPDVTYVFWIEKGFKFAGFNSRKPEIAI